ncbi:hypothetical protein Pint_06386 [Pistacia integerrima]|uniref:Uncharacterized protein n=1 Tax=Pistacia integerrima TaxID=434235 RepID=A0ACC0Z518_9ROSI|nr:hypothetical protein Pint_06386 [Pistacia integerrima]
MFSLQQIIASVGLDKKLYTYDSGSRRPSSCITYEAPFSSLAFRDDGLVLAAGTSNGRVVFYDIRSKPQPFTVLRAYGGSEHLYHRDCSFGGAAEDSILMPDPLPSVTSTSLSLSTAVPGSRLIGRSGTTAEASLLSVNSSGSVSSTFSFSSTEETPQRGHLRAGGPLARLHAPRSSYNFKDDMEVFSPLVDVQPITPSLDKLWDNHEGLKKDHLPDDTRSSFAESVSTPSPSSKVEDPSITPPEAWGGEKLPDKFTNLRLPARFGTLTSGGLTSGSAYSDLTSSLSQTNMSLLTSSNLSYENLRPKDVSSNQEPSSLGFPENFSSSTTSLSLGAKGFVGPANLDLPRTTSLTLPRRFSTYAERISTTSAFSDGTSPISGSPKTKKTGAETREEILSSLLSRCDTSAATEPGALPAINGGISQTLKASLPDPQQGSNFTLQLFQRTLEETLDSFQKSIHEDMRNLHIEILRQFHMQEMETSSVMSSILENQAELMKEIKSLRKENQHLRPTSVSTGEDALVGSVVIC